MSRNLAKKLGYLDGRPVREPDVPKYVKQSVKKVKAAAQNNDEPVAKLGWSPKYKITDTSRSLEGVRIYQIEALRDFDEVKAGDRGGHVQDMSNLSQYGNCWLAQKAACYGGGRVEGDAWAMNHTTVKDNAVLRDQACIFDRVILKGDCDIGGTAQLYQKLTVGGRVTLRGDERFVNKEDLYEYLKITGKKRSVE